MQMREDIKTGRVDTCAYCGETITEVQDPYSFVIDWGASVTIGDFHEDAGDFGCGDHPMSNEDGCYGHLPRGW